jgi:hypothetical protein
MEKDEKLEYIRNLDVIKLYHLNKSSFPPELAEAFERNYDVLYYTFRVTVPTLGDLYDLVHKLMMKQFPIFRNETRPTFVKEIESIADLAGFDLVRGIGGLMKAKRDGITTRQLYDPFDEWVEINTFTDESWEHVTDGEKMDYGAWDSTPEEWEKIKEDENIFREEEVEWLKARRFEFIDLLQNTFLKYFEGFDLLESDDLIIYALLLRSEYEEYNDRCQRLEDFLDWGLPEEDYTLGYRERMDKEIAMGNEKRWAVAELRYRRVWGEEI